MKLHHTELGQIALEMGQAFRNASLLLIIMSAQGFITSLQLLISSSLWYDELLLRMCCN